MGTILWAQTHPYGRGGKAVTIPKASCSSADAMNTHLDHLSLTAYRVPDAGVLAAGDSHLPTSQKGCPWLMGAILPGETWGSLHTPQEGP